MLPYLMSAQYSSEEQFELVQQTAAQNLIAWKASGVVKALRWYSAEDADACAPCRARHGAVVNTADAAIGVNAATAHLFFCSLPLLLPALWHLVGVGLRPASLSVTLPSPPHP